MVNLVISNIIKKIKFGSDSYNHHIALKITLNRYIYTMIEKTLSKSVYLYVIGAQHD